MFDSIAGDYDSLNHILSLDVDKIWRRRALKRIVDAPAPVRVLDLACGTGDFSIAIAKAGGTVAGRMAVLAEGDAKNRDDIKFLAPLPTFKADGSVR